MAAFCPRIKGANPVICHDGRGASFWQGSVKFAGSGGNGSMGSGALGPVDGGPMGAVRPKSVCGPN